MAKLGDFGFACFLDPHCKGLQMLVGTPSHMAPELIRQTENKFISEEYQDPNMFYNEKIDIWAIGIVTFELFTKKNAF